MTAFTLHTPETAPQEARDVLVRIQAAWTFIPNLHRMLAESPVTLKAYDALIGLVGQSSFTPAEQQVVYLAINVFHECEYCTSGHTVLARRSGLSPDVIVALRDEREIADLRLETLRRFAEGVVRERGFVGDAAVEAFLEAGFTRAQVLEVVLIAAAKTISNYANHLTHTPLDPFMAETAWVAPGNRGQAS